MKWWKKLFRVQTEKTFAPLVVDLETGKVFVWTGSQMVDVGMDLARIGLPR